MTQPQPDDSAGRTRPFADVLLELDRGREHLDLSRRFQELIAEVQRTGKAGTFAYKLTVKPAKAEGMVEVVGALTVKVPEFDRHSSMFFVDDDQNLTRDDPRQVELDLGLRDVSHREAR